MKLFQIPNIRVVFYILMMYSYLILLRQCAEVLGISV